MKKLNVQGFTIIELMVVVAVVAIITMVAVPGYTSQAKKAKRSDAQQLMLDIANRQQQYLFDARQYSISPVALNITKDGWTCDATDCDNNFYTVVTTVVNTSTPPTFTITATATGTQIEDGNLTLISSGDKTHSGDPGW